MRSETDVAVTFQDSGSYILGDRITFSVQEAVLRDESRQLEIRLQRPACRCLALLIRHQGHLVSQTELISYGWGEDRASFISLNTFYQTMHHLRLALSQAGLPDVIYTVARQGTGLSPTLNIREIPEKNVEPGPEAGDIFRRRRNLPLILSMGVIAIFVLMAGLFVLRPKTETDADDILHKYTHTSLQRCQLYRYPHSLSESQINALLSRAGLSCQEPKIVVVTEADYGERKSIMTCSGIGAEQQDCKIYFIMEPLDEK